MGEADETMVAPQSVQPQVDPEAPPERIADRYRIEGLLGVGGMGRVYRAHDEELGEVVALKTMRAEWLQTDGALARFRQEVKLARRVTHPNVARIFDIGEHAGQRFMTMELVDGVSLADQIGAHAPFAEAEAVRLLVQMARGVAAAHEQGIVHRDLKPGNVMLDRSGRAVVTDFGLARQASSDGSRLTMGAVVGTPAYMAPEQVAASEVGAAADVYALGLILFEMLTGRAAWTGRSPVLVAARRLTEPAPSPSELRGGLSAEVLALCARCLATEVEERFATAGELLAALEGLNAPGADAARAKPAPVLSGEGRDKRVAVLAFRSPGGGAESSLAAGLAEDLGDVLSMTPGLRVRHGRTSEGEDPIESGRRLGVDVVVVGTLRRREQILRVNVRVLSVADGFQLWAGRHERPLSEALTLNDEVGEAVAGALATRAAPAPRVVVQDSHAAELYFELRELMNKAYMTDTSDGELIAKLDHASSVAADDPVLAGYGLALRCRSGSLMRYVQMDEKMQGTLNRVMAMAPRLPTSWYAKAAVEGYVLHQLPAAVASLRRALALDPGHVDSLSMLVFLLVEAGMLDETLPFIRRGLWSDPTNGMLRATWMHIHARRGDLGNWREVFHSLDTPTWRGQRLISAARHSLWFGEWLIEGKLEIPPGHPTRSGVEAFRAVFEGTMTPEAIERVHEAYVGDKHPRARFHVTMSQVAAEMAAHIGALDLAMSYVRKAETHPAMTDAYWLATNPVLAPLRSMPGVDAFIAAGAERAAGVRQAFEAPLD